jgi:hypothetical protein
MGAIQQSLHFYKTAFEIIKLLINRSDEIYTNIVLVNGKNADSSLYESVKTWTECMKEIWNIVKNRLASK